MAPGDNRVRTAKRRNVQRLSLRYNAMDENARRQRRKRSMAPCPEMLREARAEQ